MLASWELYLIGIAVFNRATGLGESGWFRKCTVFSQVHLWRGKLLRCPPGRRL